MLCPAVPPIFGLFLWLLTKPCRGNGRQLRLTYSGVSPFGIAARRVFFPWASPAWLPPSHARLWARIHGTFPGSDAFFVMYMEVFDAKKASRRSLSKTPLPSMDAIIYTIRTFVNLCFTQLLRPFHRAFSVSVSKTKKGLRHGGCQSTIVLSTHEEAAVWDWS